MKADGSRMDVGSSGNGFAWLFFKCSSLTRAPDLPATQLTTRCYINMFYMLGVNTALTSVPSILPATTLPNECYRGMFTYCSAITDAPYLPAKTTGSMSYGWMFDSCSALSSMHVGLSAWPSGGTNTWLAYVAPNGVFTCPAELPDRRGSSNIPTGWTKVDA